MTETARGRSLLLAVSLTITYKFCSDILTYMNIYFSGIGGVGIGPLAQIALDAGYQVCGSDKAVSSPLLIALKERGVSISDTQDGAFLQVCHDAGAIDQFVYTSALPADHPELVLAQQLGIKTVKRHELLNQIIREKNLKLIAIAGTHGKTTTTAMMVWLFKQLGLPVSYSIGTTLSFGTSGAYQQGSEYFIYECDEYDRNFLQFSPHLSLITSIGYDHPDTYPTRADYTAAFRQFMLQSRHNIIWKDDGDKIQATANNGWILQPDEVLQIHLAGAHNKRNATLAAKAIEYIGKGSREEVVKFLQQFPGTARRFEKLADNLYTDYAVHPAEIAATLSLAREFNDHVVVVYQPHQNVRQHEVRKNYTDCFEDAEEIYWLPTYLAREDPSLPILSPAELSHNLTNKSAVHFADLNDDLWNMIQKARDAGTLVLCMGAGTIDKWLRDHLVI